MCWNWQVSLLTWIVAVVSSIYLIYRRRPNDVTIGLLLLFYSSMQFWEFLMWMDQECGRLNRVATIGAYYALYSHVLAIGLGIYIEQGVQWPLVVGIACIGVAIALMPLDFGCSRPSRDCRHLTWGFPTGFYTVIFGICLVLILSYIRPISSMVLFSSIFIGSLILSWTFRSRGGAASFWCFIAAAIGPIFIAIN